MMRLKITKHMRDKIKQAVTEFEQKQKDLNKFVQDNFYLASKEIFDIYGEKLQSFSWKQYTDYFNDGDECNFYVYCEPGYSLVINNEEPEDVDDSKMTDEIEEFIESIDSEIMKNVFGDHKRITVTRDGVKIEDYTEHD